MNGDDRTKEQSISRNPEVHPIRIKPYVLVLGIIWTLVVTASLIWNTHQTKQEILEVARHEARVAYEKDVIYRRWNSMHGGVYVPITEKSPPNPYLETSERDITTPRGVALTRMNPAYMTRQVHEMASEAYGVQGHITSLKPIRPANAADPWETQALQAFQGGVEEVSAVEEFQGQPTLRLMRPLYTEQACLSCHAVQGYQLGDIRGGISVSLPMKPFLAMERSRMVTLLLGHAFLWLLGLVGLGFGARRLAEQVAERRRAEASLEQNRDRLETINDCLLGLGPDHHANIDRLTSLCGEMLGGNCALYNRLDGGLLCSIGQWQAPPDFRAEDTPEGHICYDLIRDQNEDTLLIADLPATSYAESDLNVRALGLKTYFGHVVKCEGNRIGALCVVYQTDYRPGEDDRRVIGIIASAIGNEDRRRQANDALREREGTLRSIFRVAPIGIGLMADRVFKEVNERLCEMVGYSREELVGQRSRILYASQEEFDRVGKENHTQIEQSGAGTVETRWERKDSTTIDVLLRSTPLDPNDLAVGFTFTALDITGHKQAKDERKLNESRVEALLKLNQMTSAPLHEIAEFAMEEAVRLTQSTIGYVAFMNEDESVLTMHAWSRLAMEECQIAEKPLDYPVEKTGLWGEAVRQRRPIITNDYSAPNPFKRGTPAGHVIINRHMNVPIFDGERIVIVAGVGNKPKDYDEVDVRQLTLLMTGMWRILHRKRAEDALRVSEEKYRLVVENANDAIFIAQDGHVKFPNARLAMNSGYSVEELTQKPFLEFVHPEDREQVALRYSKRLQGEFVPNFQSFRVVSKSGETLWVEVNSVLINWEGRAASLNFLRDITVQKRLESQLLHAQKMEAIGTLAGGIAHDFNNILAAILGYTELIKVKFDPPGLHDYLAYIIRSCDRAKNLVAQILTFSRAMEQEKRPIHMPSLVEEVLKLLSATLPSTIAFRQKIASEVHAVFGDPTQIHQVLINLCINSAYAMREKGGVIEISLTNMEIPKNMVPPDPKLTPGPYVKLMVGDTGTGMAPDVMDRIFDPFFTTKKTGEGTGLGLSVVYGVVKSCGGAVTVQTEPGAGSLFTVYLPAVTDATEAEEESSEPVPGGRERILFVDDEEILVNMWWDIFENLGYEVTGTTESTRALELFRSQPDQFDLVITDMTMPVMTGVDLSIEILKLRPDIPIILCTGFNELISGEKAKELGIQRFAMKPLSLKSIAELIRKVLDK